MVGDYFWEDSRFVVVILSENKSGTISEHILPDRVPMEVHEQQKPIPKLLLGPDDLLLELLNFWEHETIFSPEQPIKIPSTNTGPKIAQHNPIRIEHGHNLHYRDLPQASRLRCVRTHPL